MLALEGTNVRSLQRLPPARSLRQLHLARNSLTSVRHLAGLFPLLEVLDISDNHITEGEELVRSPAIHTHMQMHHHFPSPPFSIAARTV